MKRIFFLLILLSTALISYSQVDSTENRRGYIGVSFGLSYPTPVTAQYTFGNIKGERGIGGSIVDFGYYLTRNFGIAAKWQGMSYGFDRSDMSFHLLRNGAAPFSIDDENWTANAFIAGLRLAHPGKKAVESLGIFGGLVAARTPDVQFYSDSTFTSSVERSGQGNAFAFGIDGRLNYHVSQKFDVMFTVEYLHANPSYDFELPGENKEFTQQVNLVNITAGFAYRLR